MSVLFVYYIVRHNNQAGTSAKAPDYGVITYGDIPAFGSVYAGGSFLDKERSAIKPHQILTRPGELQGYWLSPDKKSNLVIEQFDPDNPEHADFPVSGFERDWFRILIHDGTERRFFIYLEAAYESFYIFGSDVDGDGLDEVIMEYGKGRGTFAYSRKLEICKPGPTHCLRIFATTLNGYIGGVPLDKRPLPDPDAWERRYVFTDIDKDKTYEIILYLVPPRTIPHYLATTESTILLQFPKLVYGYNDNLRTYELKDFVFKKLHDNNSGDLRARLK